MPLVVSQLGLRQTDGRPASCLADILGRGGCGRGLDLPHPRQYVIRIQIARLELDPKAAGLVHQRGYRVEITVVDQAIRLFQQEHHGTVVVLVAVAVILRISASWL